jgi:hypothetical protein
MQTATSKPDAEGDLKSLSLPELQAKLGSSPAGLTQSEAERRLAQSPPATLGIFVSLYVHTSLSFL